MKKPQSLESILKIIKPITRFLFIFIIFTIAQPFLLLILGIIATGLYPPVDYFSKHIDIYPPVDYSEKYIDLYFPVDTVGQIKCFFMELLFLGMLAFVSEIFYLPLLKPGIIKAWEYICEGSNKSLHTEENLPQKPQNEQKTHFHHRIKNFCFKIKKLK